MNDSKYESKKKWYVILNCIFRSKKKIMKIKDKSSNKVNKRVLFLKSVISITRIIRYALFNLTS